MTLLVVAPALMLIIVGVLASVTDEGSTNSESNLVMYSYTLVMNDLTSAASFSDTLPTTGFRTAAVYVRAKDPGTEAIVVIYRDDGDGADKVLTRINATDATWTQWEGETAESPVTFKAEAPAPGGASASTQVDVLVFLEPD